MSLLLRQAKPTFQKIGKYSFKPSSVLYHERIASQEHNYSSLVRGTRSLLSHQTQMGAMAAVQNVENDSSSSRFSNLLLLGGIFTALGIQQSSDARNKTHCCGIAAVVGRKGGDDARDYLLEALNILKNRGYDSAGIATISTENNNHMSVTKYASVGERADSIDLVEQHSDSSKGSHIGIAHTRWATHGGKTDFNAHPHLDGSGKIALVHNGTINNANELRDDLRKKGYTFDSQTDTEVISKLIGHFKDTEKIDLRSATEKALKMLDGSWGLCIMDSEDPTTLVVACNGSPLVIGIGADRTYVASETSAFNRYTKNFISLKDGEIGVIHADGTTLDLRRMQKAPNQEIELSPAPYPHWTLKECFEQPMSIARALGFGGRLTHDRAVLGGLDDNMQKLSHVKHMSMSACGSSLYAAKYGEKLMKQLGNFDTVSVLDASETENKDFPNSENPEDSCMVVISQSGETKDVQRVVTAAMDKGLTVMSVVNAVGSLIARTTNLGVYCNAGRENAVASTKAFTSQITVLALIALWFRRTKDKLCGIDKPSRDVKVLSEALMRLPIVFGMGLKSHEQCKDIAKRIQDREHIFILGRGFGEPVACEGALKIKEMSYIHAEGYPGGALKHGPFALIDDETGRFGPTPIILLILDDHHANHMRTAAEEVKARGADLIIITDKPSLARGLDENPIIIPSNGPLTALGAVLPLQLLAYELAMLRGVNPDTPRNLAKAVTVD